jgi:hypothetical protein
MADLRSRLELIGDRIEPRPDAFERLERFRRRRQRNRRVVAGVVAFAVAIAGAFAAFAAFRGSESRPAGGIDRGFFALWPEATYADALAWQEEIDGGGESRLAWLLDPVATVEEFARGPLGWGFRDWGINVEVPEGVDLAGPGPITLDVYPTTHGPEGSMITEVTLARLVRPDGIWSVVDVRTDAFDLRIKPGERVALGDVVAIPTSLDEGTEVAVGVKGTAGCSGFHEETAEVLDGVIAIPIEGVGEGCSGYVYALTPPTPVGQVEPGKFMFVYGEPRPALGYTIESIAAVPVRFVGSIEESPSVEPAAADVARISCDGSTLAVQTPVVRAQPDGVHVELASTTIHPIEFRLGDLEKMGIYSAEVRTGETLSDVLPSFAPGTWPVACSSPSGAESVEPSALGSLEVVDPEGFFTPWLLDCPAGGQHTRDGPMEGVSGDPRDPLVVARGRLTGLESTDSLEPAGYAGAADPIVRVMRDGSIAGHLLFAWDDESEGWMLVQLAGCSGTSYGWFAGPDAMSNPNGWFEWCPAEPFLRPGEGWRQAASEVAARFAAAYVTRDQATLAQVLDPSVPPGTDLGVMLVGPRPTVLGAGSDDGGIAAFSCGGDVEDASVTVTIDDGTVSASADFVVYLVLREDGWKVWGVY